MASSLDASLSAEDAAEWAALDEDNEQLQTAQERKMRRMAYGRNATAAAMSSHAQAESFLQEMFPTVDPNGDPTDELAQSLNRRMDYGDIGIGTHFGGKVLSPTNQEFVLEIGACEAFDFELPPEGTQVMFDVHRDSSDRLLALNVARCEFEEGDNSADGWPHVERNSIQALVQRFGDSHGLADSVMDPLREARGSVQMAVIRLGPPEFDGTDLSDTILTRMRWVQNIVEQRSRASAPATSKSVKGKPGKSQPFRPSVTGPKDGLRGGDSDTRASYGGRARRVVQPNPPGAPLGHWPDAGTSKSSGYSAAPKHGHTGSVDSAQIAKLKDAVVTFVAKGFYSEVLGYKTRIMHVVRDPDVRAAMQSLGLHAREMKDWFQSEMKREVKLKADPSCTYGYQVNMGNTYDPMAHMANVYLHGEAPPSHQQSGQARPFKPSLFAGPTAADEHVHSGQKRPRKSETGHGSGRSTYGGGPAAKAAKTEANNDLVTRVKQLQRSDKAKKLAWGDYCDQHLGGVRDPARHDASVLQGWLLQHE